MKTKQITIKGFIHYYKSEWRDQATYSFYEADMSSTRGFGVVVMPHEFTIDVPADFDPTPQMIAALENEKAKARKEFNDRIAQLNDEITKLQALPCEVKS